MLRLYLVRHGETVWNQSLRYQGHTDVPLSDTGRRQAELLAGRLAREEIDAFFASDLSRARETAEILARPHGKEVIIDPLFRETKFGHWEGLTYQEIVEKYPREMAMWRERPSLTRIPGGETLDEVASRIRTGLERLLARYPQGKVVLVAHGGVNRIIICQALGLPVDCYWKIRQDNTALNIIEYYDQGEKAILCLLNDTNHLCTAL